MCVCFFPGPDCMCMFFCASEVHVCTQSPHTFFFFSSWAWRHFLLPPSVQTASLFLCTFFFFLSLLNSVQQFTGSGFDSPFDFFVYSEFITQIFPPLSFLPDSQAAAVPNSLALHFFKATFKNKLITHRPLMKSC